MARRVAGVLGILLLLAASRPPDCTLDISPHVGQAPFRYLRITTHIADPPRWRVADVALVDDFDLVTSTLLFIDDGALYAPRTAITEWKTLSLDPGVYVVELTTRAGSATCHASTRLEVH